MRDGDTEFRVILNPPTPDAERAVKVIADYLDADGGELHFLIDGRIVHTFGVDDVERVEMVKAPPRFDGKQVWPKLEEEDA